MRCLYLVFLILIGYIYAQNNKKHPNDLHDQLRTHAAKRLVNMSYELVVEAKLLQRQMQPIQKYYEGQVTYEIGYVMGKIRERYKRMIEIYKQAHYMTKHLYLDEKNISQLNTSLVVPPGIKMYYPINWVINMEYMRLFEVDIDKLVEVLENIPAYALKDIDKSSQSSSKGKSSSTNSGMLPGHEKPTYKPPTGVASQKLPSKPIPKVPTKPRGPTSLVRTGEGPGYPPGAVGSLRSEPPSIPNEPPPSVPNEPPPSVPNEPLPSVANEPPPSVPNEPPPSVLNEPPPSVANEPPPSVPNEPPPSVLNEPPPSVPNEPPLSVPNEPLPSVANEPPPSVPNEPPPSVLNEPPPSVPNEPPLSDPNEPPPSVSNEPLPSVPNEPPLGQTNEPPPGRPNELPPDPLSQPYDSPPSFPNESPLGPSDEPPPDPEKQSYGPPQSQSYKSPPTYPNEATLRLSNEPPPDPERQAYEAPQSQPYDSPLSQPDEPPPGQPYEPLPSPPSWPTEPPAASYGKVIRFGSADTNFRTEEELKQYYRAMYRAKHDGMNDKYDNLYR